LFFYFKHVIIGFIFNKNMTIVLLWINYCRKTISGV